MRLEVNSTVSNWSYASLRTTTHFPWQWQPSFYFVCLDKRPHLSGITWHLFRGRLVFTSPNALNILKNMTACNSLFFACWIVFLCMFTTDLLPPLIHELWNYFHFLAPGNITAVSTSGALLKMVISTLPDNCPDVRLWHCTAMIFLTFWETLKLFFCF